MDGIIPSLDTVERFARGFGLDVNEWRELAGYEPILPTEPTEPTYAEVFAEGYRAMKERLAAQGIPAPSKGANLGGSAGLTAEDAAAEIAELERVLRRLAGEG